MNTTQFLDELVRTAKRTLPYCDNDKDQAAQAALDEAHVNLSQESFFALTDALGGQKAVLEQIVSQL